MDVILLFSGHQTVSPSHVAIFRGENKNKNIIRISEPLHSLKIIYFS
jgi:hypothetical protein